MRDNLIDDYIRQMWSDIPDGDENTVSGKSVEEYLLKGTYKLVESIYSSYRRVRDRPFKSYPVDLETLDRMIDEYNESLSV